MTAHTEDSHHCRVSTETQFYHMKKARVAGVEDVPAAIRDSWTMESDFKLPKGC